MAWKLFVFSIIRFATLLVRFDFGHAQQACQAESDKTVAAA